MSPQPYPRQPTETVTARSIAARALGQRQMPQRHPMPVAPTRTSRGSPCANPALPPRLRVLLATADTATERNDRILGVQCILQIFAGFDRTAQTDAPQPALEAAHPG